MPPTKRVSQDKEVSNGSITLTLMAIIIIAFCIVGALRKDISRKFHQLGGFYQSVNLLAAP